MPLNALKKKLENLKGVYTFNFANECDCEYLFEQYDGENNMKQNYPQIYKSFLNAREKSLRINETSKGETANTYKVSIGKLQIDPENKPQCDTKKLSEQTGKLKVDISCVFIDETKKVNEKEPAAPWKGIIIQTKIKDKKSSKYFVRASKYIKPLNSYEGFLCSNPEYLSDLYNKNYLINIDLQATDTAGILHKQRVQREEAIGDFEDSNHISDIVIFDPVPRRKSGKRIKEISMLYGRIPEGHIFGDADYKGGDFEKKTFVDGHVHLLIPMRGYVEFEYGVQPQGLAEPLLSEALERPIAAYDNKRICTYRNDIQSDRELYERLKDCFTIKQLNPNDRPTIEFDIKIADGDRSLWDWHDDIIGTQSGQTKTINLDGVFSLSLKSQRNNLTEQQIRFKSVTPDFIKEREVEYYKYYGKSNTVYIPQIKIYWGCFAKDVIITMADGTKKLVCDITMGDMLLGYDNKILEVSDVITGRETSIYSIMTKNHGSIKVSGGHPMMCDGVMKRAYEIKEGDNLNLADGNLAQVQLTKVVDYNDTVYNFFIKDELNGVYLIANGFYSGDLKMQNTEEDIPQKPFTKEEEALIAENERFYKNIEEESIGDIK